MRHEAEDELERPAPVAPLPPEYRAERKATTRKTMPGTAERWICRGGAGRPDSAATTGSWVIARAGRAAAKIGGDHGEHHRRQDHDPRQREHRR